MNRRSFLQCTSAAFVGGLAWNRVSLADADLSNVGVQLYTLRDLMAADFPGTLKRVADVGYPNVEFAGYYEREPADIRKMLDDLGLKAVSGHFGMRELRENPDAIIEGAHTLGMSYVVLPALGRGGPEGIDRYKSAAAFFNEFGAKVKEAGMQFGYHNHSFEFEEIDGVVPYDILLDETDADLVAMELDLCWIVNAKHDPLAYFERYPGRFHLWHVKDLTTEGELADVGKGDIDFPAIFAQAKKSGLRYAIVEHDRPDDPVTSITTSLAYLRENLG